MRNLLLSLLFSLSMVSAFGQNDVAMNAWMGQIDDSMLVARMLIPGAHDAATGDGFYHPQAYTYAATQDIPVRLQFESGIRAFDLRPVMHNDTMQVAHALFDTRLTFSAALDAIIAELDAHPSEFAIVLMRNESDTERGAGSWAALMESELSRVSHRLAEFSPTVRVGQLRGKILLLTRDRYSGRQYGAYIPDWPDMPTMAECPMESNDGQSTIVVQDYYQTDGGRQQTKCDAIDSLLRFSSEQSQSDSIVWIANYASGYAQTTSEGYSLSSGYRQNAAATSASLCRSLAAWQNTAKPSGIVFMDFAGVDLSEGYAVGGRRLTEMIVNRNIK